MNSKLVQSVRLTWRLAALVSGTIPRGVSIRMAQNCIDALPNGFGHRDASAACEFLQPAMLGRLQLDLRLDHMMPPLKAIMISPRGVSSEQFHPHYRAN